MKLATIKNLKKSYGDRLLLDIDKFEINEKDKIGIVGENGVGKTTLLKILLGQIKPDEGEVYLTKDYSYISQVEEKSEKCKASRLKKILNVPNQYEEYLSGGEKVKVRVLNAIEGNPSLLIADEPTANLDSESIEVIDGIFKKFKGAVLIVSHDRKFLDDICNKIVELAEGNFKLYQGNYSEYRELKKENYQNENNQYKKYIHEKARLEKVICKKSELRDKIHKAPKGMGKSEAKTIKMGDQRGKKNIENNIKNIEKRIEHLEVKKPPKKREKIIININEGNEVAAKNLIEIKNFKLVVGDKVLVDDINLNIKNGYNIALIGKNGCGKTTLINEIIKGNNKEIKVSSAVKIGYFDQRQDILDAKKSILENIKADSLYDESFLRINLSEFGFKNEAVNKKVKELSGGEKVKVAICKIILANNNLLILDEPTNYLDVETIEALEEALINTNKTVLLVCHDIEFISHICNYIIEIKNNKLEKYEGNYNDYLEIEDNKEIKKQNKKLNDKILLLENKISEILSLLAVEKNEDKKEKINKEYFQLMEELHKLKDSK